MAELPEGVSWTQDADSVEIIVSVPSGTSRANLRVQTTADSVAVEQRASDCWRPVVTGMLRHDVERESCCWSLEKQRGGTLAVVIQLEKAQPGQWDALLRASVAGSILEELGRDQVIVDAGASTSESLVCGRCGALVKASRMEAHTTMWCEALTTDEDRVAGDSGDAGGRAEQQTAAAESDGKSPSSHLYWARTPTNPAGTLPPNKLLAGEVGGELV